MIMMIYVHIPFCVRKCAYCDFLSYESGVIEREEYVKNLIKSMTYSKKTTVTSIFFGGGTPTILSANQIQSIMNAIFVRYIVAEDAEISIETNPETVDREKLCQLKELGFNRISIGVQSFNNIELELLGRVHNAERAYSAFDAARVAGFDNINLDLMYGLPNQSARSFEASLNAALTLSPEHISCYALSLEPGTGLEEAFKSERLFLPDEDSVLYMEEVRDRLLSEYGYIRYEISNYAKEGFTCRHNLGYWGMEHYEGFGYGAAGFIAVGEAKYRYRRYKNDCGIDQMHRVSDREEMEEYMFLGLRRIPGVRKSDFFQRFGKTVEQVYGAVLTRYQRLCLLDSRDGYITLSPKGLNLSNLVLADFLL